MGVAVGATFLSPVRQRARRLRDPAAALPRRQLCRAGDLPRLPGAAVDPVHPAGARWCSSSACSTRPVALILTYPTFLIPFCTWLLIGYFKSIPYELEECALIDGATRLQILRRITLPLAVPGLISAGIFAFTLSWNEFIYALAFIQSSEKKTVPVAILTELVTGDVYQWGALMAGALLGSLPVAIFYSFFVEYYVSSLTGRGEGVAFPPDPPAMLAVARAQNAGAFKPTGGSPMPIFTRRGVFAIGTGTLAAAALGQPVYSAVPAANVEPPKHPIEKDAVLRVARPNKFIAPDETIWNENTEKFTKATGVQVRVDYVGWEDLRPQTAVTANTGAGPDIVVGWADDPQLYATKLLDMSELADYLGKKYGGWKFQAQAVRPQVEDQRLDLPFRSAAARPVQLPRLLGEGGRLRRDPERPRPVPRPLPQAQEERPPARLRAGQRGGRRQRLCQLAALDARRLHRR